MSGGRWTTKSPGEPTGQGDTHVIRQTFLFLLCITFAVPAIADDEADVYRRLTESKSSALVTVKFLLRMEGQFGKRESETEITGIMIDAKGLILCANSKLGAPRRFGSATPTDIKVLIGDDIDGLPAKVLARDTELDLAWVQIKEPGEKTFEFMNLADPGEPKIGDRLYALRRMAKFFDRTPIISDGRLAGRAKKPRDLLVPAGLSLDAGQPVLTADGKLVGIVSLQLPEDEEFQANPMAFMSIGRDIGGGLILPTAQVAKATARALEAAKDEEEEDDADADAETTKPSEKKDDGERE